MIRHSRYVIAVHDLERSARYCREVLGFEVREIGDPGWRFFLRNRCFIMAGECPRALSPRELGDHSYFAYLEVDEIDQLYEAVIARDATVIKELCNEPWGIRDIGIRTVDGHRIMWGCPTEGAEQAHVEGREPQRKERVPWSPETFAFGGVSLVRSPLRSY
jgi:hypothetical protein